jgi:hypothetical protein
MFSAKELRGKNSMLDRVQRQQDSNYSDSLAKFSEECSMKKMSGKKLNILEDVKEPIRSITKAELGKKRSILR